MHWNPAVLKDRGRLVGALLSLIVLSSGFPGVAHAQEV
jgi:hypothetical protein